MNSSHARNDWSLRGLFLKQDLQVEVEPEKAVDGKEDYQVLSRVAQPLIPIELKGEIDGKWDEGVEEVEEVEDVALHQREVWSVQSSIFSNNQLDALSFDCNFNHDLALLIRIWLQIKLGKDKWIADFNLCLYQ